jgi:hypothetical protein
MSDIPDDLLPDDPQRIGEVGDCDWCDKHTYVYLGLDEETHEAKRMCILCRAKYADSPADNPE